MKNAIDFLSLADLKILVLDASDENCSKDFMMNHRDIIDKNTICLLNKSDLCHDDSPHASFLGENGCLVFGEGMQMPSVFLPISLHTKSGLGRLEQELTEWVTMNCIPDSGATVTKVRYQKALRECLESLRRLNNDMGYQPPLDVLAEEVRAAANALGSITGKIQVEEILDEIFSSFCIGK